MLFGFLTAILIIVGILLVLLIMIQQGKGNMGFGNMGGATQMIFGGSGGQDIFQKITWGLGATFMGLSLFLALLRAQSLSYNFPYGRTQAPISAPAQAGTEAGE